MFEDENMGKGSEATFCKKGLKLNVKLFEVVWKGNGGTKLMKLEP